jgi:KAP family P-loop domain
MVSAEQGFRDKTIPAADLVVKILRDHPYYGGGNALNVAQRLASLDSSASKVERQTTSEWLIQTAVFLRSDAVITGRCVVAALAMLDRRVGRELLVDGFLAALMSEAPDGRPSVQSQLTVEALQKFDEFMRIGRDSDSLSGSTETLSDAPAKSKAEDRLGRAAFAEVLAENIRRLRRLEEKAPLVVHLDGPWGSGKSTVLNFLDLALATGATARERWTILRYNAWQQQRGDSPWWALATLIAVEGQRQLWSKNPGAAGWMGLRHFWFRTFAGRVPVLLAAMAAISFGLVAYYVPIGPPPAGGGPTRNISQLKDILSIATIIFGAVIAASRFITATDATAQEFLKSRPDPVGALVRHTEFLLRTLGQPVAILVDDMDRCDAAAVVRVLEGIHTVFGTLQIVFVIAGDGRWIARAFEKTYADNSPNIGKTTFARPLGALFLEKIFQLSAVVPDMPQAIKNRYWRELLKLPAASPEAGADEEAKHISTLRTEEEILATVASVDPLLEPARAQALREAAMRRLVQPDLIENPSRHVLEIFGRAIEANPRAMKRQVMAYGMARACDLASFRNTPQQLLAAWSVLCMRWPTLADWIREKPDRIAMQYVDPENADEAQDSKAFLAMMRQPEVRTVLDELRDVQALHRLLGRADETSAVS